MNNLPPPITHLEISLFGPGVGECVVAHIGNGSWMIIDSCVDANNNPVAISYLRELGVDVEQDVKLIVVSHWHDDHIRGMGRLVEECKKAKIVISAALLRQEFLTLVNVMNDPNSIVDRGKSGLNEMASVIKSLKNRKSGENNGIELVQATADKRLFDQNNVEVWALSPSDHTFNNALQEFGALTNQLSSTYRGIVPTPSENRNAVAIWIKFEDINVILGADLEESNGGGWSAIVRSVGRPKGKASIFKVPHHGSENGYCAAVTSQMLDNPISILTAFRRSKIPSETDLKRISSFSKSVYLTTPAIGKKPRRKPAVEKLFKSSISDRIVLGGEIGHIQLRGRKEMEVNMAGPAKKVA